MTDPSENNVWDTAERVATNALGVYRDLKIATRAAPSGNVVYTNSQNPLPGSQGEFPQAEGKPTPGGGKVSFTLSSVPWFVWAGVGALLVMLFLRRR